LYSSAVKLGLPHWSLEPAVAQECCAVLPKNCFLIAFASVSALCAGHAEMLWVLRREWSRARVEARGSTQPENLELVRRVAREVLMQVP